MDDGKCDLIIEKPTFFMKLDAGRAILFSEGIACGNNIDSVRHHYSIFSWIPYAGQQSIMRLYILKADVV